MQPDSDAGLDGELPAPARRHFSEVLQNEVARADRLLGPVARAADAEAGHHTVTCHVENLATVQRGGGGQYAEEFIEQGHNAGGCQPLGESRVAAQIRK